MRSFSSVVASSADSRDDESVPVQVLHDHAAVVTVALAIVQVNRAVLPAPPNLFRACQRQFHELFPSGRFIHWLK